MSRPKSLLLAAVAAVAAAPAAADPLDYTIATANLVRLLFDGTLEVSLVPPVGEPIDTFVIGSTETLARPSGSAVADTGLPASFNGGTQEGIYIPSFHAHVDLTEQPLLFTDLFSQLIPLLPVPPPIPLVGAAGFVDIADLDVETVTPLSSNLISISDPNEYSWGGVAGLRISGTLNLLITIPGRDPIALGPVPFDQTVNPAALEGTFTGDAGVSTRLVVGSDDAVVDPNSIPPVAPVVIPLAPLGNIEIRMNRMRIAVNGRFNAINTEYGLPPPWPQMPGGSGGCGIGPELAAVIPLLGWLWRRKRIA